MKNIFLFLLFGFSFFTLNINNSFAYNTAGEAFQDVLKSSLDDKREIPVFLKSVEKEFKDDQLKSKKYLDLRKENLEYVTLLPEKKISTNKEALNIVLELNKRIKDLNKAKSNSDKASKLFGLKSKKLSTGNPSIDAEFARIFNKFISYEIENFANSEHQNILEQLYKTRDFYTYLSKTKNQFIFINGYPIFESKLDQYEYYKYLANLRNLNKAYLNLENKKIEYLKNSEFVSFFEQSQIDLFNNILSSNNSLLAKWNAPASEKDWNLSWLEENQSNIVSDLNKSELDLRRSRSENFQKINTQIQENTEEYQKFGVYDKEIFRSKESLKKAITLSKNMLLLFKSLDNTDYIIRVQYEKDFPFNGNIYRDLILFSDQDFYNFHVFMQKQSLYNEDIEVDLKIYNLALNNFSKMIVDFESEKIDYRLKFQNKTINSSYKKIIDSYRSKYKEIFDYIDKYNQNNTVSESKTV